MSKPKKLKRVIIKEELVALTDDYIAALALCQFLYWSERRNDFDKFILEEKQRQPDLNADLTHGWIYKSIDELYNELMLKPLSPSTLRRRVETLVERGWVDRRRNPQFKWDKTWQYRPNIFKIQHDLLELGYSLEGYPLQFDKCILQGEKSNIQGETSSIQGEKSDLHGEIALPEITTEIIKDNNNKEKPKKSVVKSSLSTPNLQTQAAYGALVAAGIEELAASRLAAKVDPVRVRQVCVTADLKDGIEDKPAWIVAALNNGWNVSLPKDDTKPRTEQDRALAAGEYRVKDPRTGGWKTLAEMRVA